MAKVRNPPSRKRQKADDAEAAEQQKEVTADLPATAAAAFMLGATLHLPKT